VPVWRLAKESKRNAMMKDGGDAGLCVAIGVSFVSLFDFCSLSFSHH